MAQVVFDGDKLNQALQIISEALREKPALLGIVQSAINKALIPQEPKVDSTIETCPSTPPPQP